VSTRLIWLRRLALATALAFVTTACSSDDGGGGGGSDAASDPGFDTTTTSTTAPPATTSTTIAPPVGATNPLGLSPPLGLGKGARGEQVRLMEQRLDALRFDVLVDGNFDETTYHAAVAFQKLHRLPRTGRATQDVLDRMSLAQPPPPLVPHGGPTRVEIELARQVLFLYQGNALHKILPVSTGSGKPYCENGNCGDAITSRGSFKVEWRYQGWRKSDLGRLFNPLYFNGGIAIHGFPQVPVQPASHGCVRIPMGASLWFPQLVPDNTPVFVV
jgi:peptidoglycan hydrolase-like protein with peptidoglycan-binding domain